MATKSFNQCLDIVTSLVPRSLSGNEEYSVILKLLAYAMMKNYDNLARIDNAYNTDFVADSELPKLADTIGIVYPIGASAEILRLLLKYYGKIIKSRGTLDSIKQLVRLLETNEADIYAMPLEAYSDIQVVQEEAGFIKIMFDGIKDFDYTYSMLRKVVPAGYRYELSNMHGPITKGYDTIVNTSKLSNLQGFTYCKEIWELSDKGGLIFSGVERLVCSESITISRT